MATPLRPTVLSRIINGKIGQRKVRTTNVESCADVRSIELIL